MTHSIVPTGNASELNREHLIEALQHANEPVSIRWVISNLPKHLRASITQLEALLQEATAARAIWQFGPPERLLYWHSEPKAWVRNRLIYKLSGGAKKKSEVIGEVYGLITVKGLLPKSLLEKTFKELVDEKRIQKHPAYLGGRSDLFSIRSPDPTDYIQNAFQKLAKKLAISQDELAALAAKVTFHERVPVALSPHVPSISRGEVRERILQAMREVNPRVETGDVVAITELRQRLDISLDQATFDQAVLDLAAEHRIALHVDDHARLRSAADQAALVRDESGKFYNVISLRRPS